MSAPSAKLLAAVAIAAIGGVAFAADDHSSSSTSASVSNPNNCKVVERKPGENPSGTLSSSVTAGGGRVSANSTGGNGVTVHSGNGNTSSAVTTTGSGNGSTIVTTSDGNCIIYVNPGEKKEH
jgi:hypothetical protein